MIEAMKNLPTIEETIMPKYATRFAYFSRNEGRHFLVAWEYENPYLWLEQDPDNELWRAHGMAHGPQYETPEEALVAAGLDPSNFLLPTGWTMALVRYPDRALLARGETSADVWKQRQARESVFQPFPVDNRIEIGDVVPVARFTYHRGKTPRMTAYYDSIPVGVLI
jgi:hypothetical protein